MEMIILRGLPGSGKSHYAAQFAANEPTKKVVVASADDFFMTPNGYRFDPFKLTAAHASCFRRVLNALEADVDDMVFVDNTNSTAWEMSPYVMLANVFDVPFVVFRIECDPEVAYARQRHGVPRETFDAIGRRLATEWIPPWWVQRSAPVMRRR